MGDKSKFRSHLVAAWRLQIEQKRVSGTIVGLAKRFLPFPAGLPVDVSLAGYCHHANHSYRGDSVICNQSYANCSAILKRNTTHLFVEKRIKSSVFKPFLLESWYHANALEAINEVDCLAHLDSDLA